VKPDSIYKERIAEFTSKHNSHKNKLLISSLLRLSLFVLSAVGIYFFWSQTNISVSIFIGFAIVFAFMVKRHSALKRQNEKYKILISINKNELKFLDGERQIFKNGEEYKDGRHEFSEDIDLFGDKSFFQFLNRTGTKTGELLLAELLKSNDTSHITEKQNSIKELSEKIEFRQNFTAEALMLEDQSQVEFTVKNLEAHQSFIPKWMKAFGIVFSLLSLAVIVTYGLDYLNTKQLFLWIFVGLGITGIYLKKINILSRITAQAQDTFRQYQRLIEAVEKEQFSAPFLVKQQSVLTTEQKSASQSIQEFSKYIDALEQRQNFLVGFVLNAFFLWDLRQCFKIEKWLFSHKNQLNKWFNVIDYFDAQNSLANLSFNQTDYTFPIIDGEQNMILDSKQAAHPLISSTNVVKNSFKIRDEDFLIITGANMAGKSTFLRTVSLMIVMANCGLPVYATSCTYKPIKLITSMRTTDSLSDEASYFYSELSRLKVIIDFISRDKYFIVLDEILKGTNSHDKAKGSKQFVEKLVNSKSSGIIATHDLSLCTLEDSLESVKNYYFDAEIINDELYFDYSLKEGICQNMNASFLLKKMGIV
jgi:DNA mismatch repair ATPase MutS